MYFDWMSTLFKTKIKIVTRIKVVNTVDLNSIEIEMKIRN